MDSKTHSREEYRGRLYDQYLRLQGRESKAGSECWYLRRIVERFFPQDRSVNILDLGCGYGSLLSVLRDSGYRSVLGVDRSPEQVAAARKAELPVVESDVTEFLSDSSAERFDVVVAFDVLEHFAKVEVLSLTDNIARVLKPGGLLVAHVPNGEAIFSGRIFWADFTHELAFTPSSMRQLLTACGFASVSCYEDTPIVHGFVSACRRALWGLGRTLFRILCMAETGEGGGQLVLSQSLLVIAKKGEGE